MQAYNSVQEERETLNHVEEFKKKNTKGKILLTCIEGNQWNKYTTKTCRHQKPAFLHYDLTENYQNYNEKGEVVLILN